ncbi:MAG: SAM-dependent methyltransferase, partial [Candidatus Latescibacteria bacterium]|nr:SAM-dependent methyltransferase [Candidatus Latescibacterota bacterium]
MTQQEITFIQSAPGRSLLQHASQMSGDELTVLTQLRKIHPPEDCRTVVHLLNLRKRAQAKFTHANDMVFDREGLEQSSGEIIAQYRAKRYQPFAQIADLCCGIGGDAIPLAQNATVITADINPNRLAITRHNASVHNVAQSIHPICTNVAHWIPPCDAIFMDPGRRQDGRRLYALSDYHPPVDLQHLQSITPNIGIKVAPGLPESDIPPSCEVEFISESGNCKEAILWFGTLQSNALRRATLLPEGHTLIQDQTST